MTPLLQPRTSGRRTSPPKVMACNGPGPIVEITFRYQPAKSRHKLDELWTDTFPWQLGESDRRRVSRPGAPARLVPASTPGRSQSTDAAHWRDSHGSSECVHQLPAGCRLAAVRRAAPPDREHVQRD